MEIYVARQPIFNRKKVVVAYEVLHREGKKNSYEGGNDSFEGDEATRHVVNNVFMNIGIKNITGDKKAFVNFTGRLIEEDIPLFFSPNEIVVEILENVEVNDQLLAALGRLKDAGYTIAMDDYIGNEYFDEVIPYADIIKVDFMEISETQIKLLSRELLKQGKVLLAEKVETKEEFEFALSEGFEYFQGYFFAKPIVVKGRAFEGSQLSYIRILSALNAPNPEYGNIVSIIEEDVALTFKLLRLINSPAFYSNSKITSVKHALVRLGFNEIRKWIAFIMLKDIGGEKPKALTDMALVRAKFCEQLAEQLGLKDRKHEYFLLGMLSLLDSIMNRSMMELMMELPLEEDIKGSLLGEAGMMKDILEVVVHYQIGDWGALQPYIQKYNLQEELLLEMYFNSLKITEDLSF